MTLKESLISKRSKGLEKKDLDISQEIWEYINELFVSFTPFELRDSDHAFVEVDFDINKSKICFTRYTCNGSSIEEYVLEAGLKIDKEQVKDYDIIMQYSMKRAGEEGVNAYKLEESQFGNVWAFRINLTDESK